MKSLYRCLIVEDDPVYSKKIFSYLEKYNNFRTPKTCCCLSDALIEIKKTNFDILFTNVYLPDGNSINFININCLEIPVILLSADKEHSLAAYEANVVDYLVKPFTRARFDRAVSKAIEIIVGRNYLGIDKSKSKHPGKLDAILSSRFGLTKIECSICGLILDGKSTQEIMNTHSITQNTYKTHMKKIYSKTIDLNADPADANRRKLARLTYFLFHLK